MSKPQQAEIGRSRKTPAQDPDSAASILEAHGAPSAKGPSGPVPPENQPGHHPAQEQDKPDPEAFAAKLGITDPAGQAEVSSTDLAGHPSPGIRWKAAGLAGLAVVAGAGAGVGLRRRRARASSARRR